MNNTAINSNASSPYKQQDPLINSNIKFNPNFVNMSPRIKTGQWRSEAIADDKFKNIMELNLDQLNYENQSI